MSAPGASDAVRRVARAIALAAPVALWPLALVALALEAVLRSDLVAGAAFAALGVARDLPEAAALHARVIDFLLRGRPLEGTPFAPEEIVHLADVAALLRILRWCGVAAAVALVPLTLRGARRWWWLNRAARLMAGLGMAAALLAIDWQLLFRALHPLLFTGGWDFDAQHHLLPRLYPDAFFAILGGVALGIAGLAALALGLWSWRRLPPDPRPAWRWRRALWLWPAAALAVAWPLRALGWRLDDWHGAPAWTAWCVFAIVAAASVAAWQQRDRAQALALLGAALLAQRAFALGVGAAVAEAERSVADGGERLVAAIRGHERATGLPPPTLDALIGSRLPELPPLRVGARRWYLVVDGRRWWLGFRGPLAWHYEYASETGRWNTMPW